MRLHHIVFLVLVSSLNPAVAAPAVKPSPVRTGASAFSRNAVLPKWAEPLEPVPATASEEPVVIRLAEAQYWTGANSAFLVNRAVQVNSSSRLSELGQVAIPFIPAYQKLVLHRVAILRDKQVLDRTQTVNVRVLDSENGVEKGYYSGESTVQLLLEDVKPGDTLWTVYSVEGSNPVFGTTWSEQLPWTKASPMEVRKVTVLYPAGQPLPWRVSGVARPSLRTPLFEQRNGVGKLVFRETGLAAEEYEPSTPPELIPIPVLDLGGYPDWNQVARWATALFSGTAGTADMQALARKFDGDTPEARASQALHWVQDEIRYFSVSMGENSHRPQPPEVVLKRRFGDCKDKTQLLVALYHAMGLEAQPVLLHATSPQLPAQFQPSPMSFNHAIVRVVLNGKAYFVDPTLQNERGQISALAAPAPSAAVLIVSDDSTGLTNLPDDSVDQPLVERSERLEISALRADAQLRSRTEYRGRYAAGMRRSYRALSSVELKKGLLEQFERTYPGVRIDGAATLSDGADGASFIVEANFTIPKILKEKGGSLHLAQRSHVLEGTLGIPEKLVRKHPFWLAAGHYRARYNLDVSLPSEARLMKEDERMSVETKYFDAHGQVTWRGAHLNYYIDYAITNPAVAAADLPGLAEQVRKLDPLFESDFQFKPVDVAPQAAKSASLRVLDIMQKLSRYEAWQVEAMRTGKTPELKLDDSEYAKLNYRALCESALDSYSVRSWSPLLGQSARALYKLVDTHGDKRAKELCLARLYFTKHDVAAASKALAALAPADDDPLTLMQAWADFHARQPLLAGGNLSRFVKAKSLAGTLRPDDALLALALAKRLGVDAPPEIGQLVSSLRPAAWPMPLFSFLRGTLSEEGLHAAMKLLPLEAQEYADMESHFFISQAYLAAHEPRKADMHLNWLARYGLRGDAFEVLADADKYSEERADPDMREAWKIEEKPNSYFYVQYQKAAAQKGITEAQYVMGRQYLQGGQVMQDIPRALALLEAAAGKGSSDAMNQLGIVYAVDAKIKHDQPRALAYYRQAAENGNGAAALNLGRTYWFGLNGMSIDLDSAFRYMRDASELESTEAQFFLSRMYFEGKGTEKNDTLAMFWASQSYFRKDVDGMAQLGLLMLKLRKDEKSRLAGVDMLTKAVRQGNSYAQIEYANLLLGSGKESDRKTAFQLLQLASTGGDEHAAVLLGRMYVEGWGVDVDVSRGMEILAKQEADNVPDAYFQVGNVYRGATAGMTNKAKAADHFRRGAEMGQREAAEALAVMLHTGEGIAANLPEAMRYYTMAAQSGYPRAMNNLASMYEKGEVAPPDIDKAINLYRGAAQMGHASAMLNLAELYETGPLAKKDVFIPLAYYMLASQYGLQDADEGLQRLKGQCDQATVEKAQLYVSSWKPGSAMPEET